MTWFKVLTKHRVGCQIYVLEYGLEEYSVA